MKSRRADRTVLLSGILRHGIEVLVDVRLGRSAHLAEITRCASGVSCCRRYNEHRRDECARDDHFDYDRKWSH
jgi:hypothetical protein